MEVDKDIPAKLGTAPTATIRPTTLLGGNYFVDLKPGGDPGEFHDVIPVAHTTLPVELDKLLDLSNEEVRTVALPKKEKKI